MKHLFKFMFVVLTLFVLCSCDQTTTTEVPTNLEINGTVLSWTGIDGTNQYTIQQKVKYNDETTNLIANSSSTSYDFKNLFETYDELYDEYDIIFAVRSSSQTDFSETVTYHRNVKAYAPVVTNLQIKDKVLTFKPVSNVTEYKLIITSSTYNETFTTVNSSFDLSTLPFGEFTIKVISLKGTYYENDSPEVQTTYVYLDPNDLGTLTSITLKDYTTKYLVDELFDNKGTLVLTYDSGKSKEVSLEEIKTEITTNFTSSEAGTKTFTLTYLELSTSFTVEFTSSSLDLFEAVEGLAVFSVDFSSNSNDSLTVITWDDGQRSIILDYSFNATQQNKNKLEDFLKEVGDGSITYYYSKNNSSYFSTFSGAKALSTSQETKIDTSVSLKVTSTYFALFAFNYIYLNAGTMSTSDLTNFATQYKKVDVLVMNKNVNTTNYSKLDPEVVILPEGTLNTDNVNMAKLVYTQDNQTRIYVPSLNGTIWTTFSDLNYDIDGLNDKELSSFDEWSNTEESMGLHYAGNQNYVYRSAYYGDVGSLVGQTLLNALAKVITNTHTKKVTYGDDRYYAKETDADPEKPGNIILIYTGLSVSGEWDYGGTWNREHVWPKSLSGGLYTSISNGEANAGSDLHHIRPASTSVNSSRGNKPYGPQTDSTYYCPRDAVKGDVARILFYMSCRYNMSITNLRVAKSMQLVIDWNNLDAPDSFERARNNAVGKIQGNYNPFIDNPWFVEAIWK